MKAPLLKKKKKAPLLKLNIWKCENGTPLKQALRPQSLVSKTLSRLKSVMISQE